MQNVPTARPAIEVGLLYVLSIFWLGMCFYCSISVLCSTRRVTSVQRVLHLSLESHPHELQFYPRRYADVPLSRCTPLTSPLLSEFADMRGWCRDVQALKSFVWIEFVASASNYAYFSCLRN